MALSLAIDRDYVANTVMQGTYSPATNFVGPGLLTQKPVLPSKRLHARTTAETSST